MIDKELLFRKVCSHFSSGVSAQWINKVSLDDFCKGRSSSLVFAFIQSCILEIDKAREKLLSPHPDATDLWRENLKAWNLKQREESQRPTVEHYKVRGGKVTCHYKGEF